VSCDFDRAIIDLALMALLGWDTTTAAELNRAAVEEVDAAMAGLAGISGQPDGACGGGRCMYRQGPAAAVYGRC